MKKDTPAGEKLLRESFDFIQNNMDVYAHEIPEHLRLFWMQEDEEDEFPLRIFLYAFRKYRDKKGLNNTISTKNLHLYNRNFRLLLMLSQFPDISEINTKAIKIFDFDSYENIGTGI